MVRRLLQTTLLIAFGAPALACSDSSDSPARSTEQVVASATPGSAGSGAGGSNGSSTGAAGMGAGSAGTTGAVTDLFPPSDHTAHPSAGCTGNAAPAVGGQTLMSGGQVGNYLITVPAGYDGTTPQALAFVFHGANNTEITCRGGGNCTGVQASMESKAITVYPRSFGNSWTDATREQNVTWFDDVLSFVEANYCVDERRVFAMGTSSGAHFSNILGCRRGDVLLAVAPGAGERLETTGCRGEVAALVIHGVDDTSVRFPLGEAARDYYAMANGCSNVTVPPIAEVHAEVRARRDAPPDPDAGVLPGIFRCADYQGCREGLPVRWCEHGEGGYDGSTHGYPVEGGSETWDFVSEL